MVLTNAVDVEPDLIGQRDLVQQVAQALGVDGRPRGFRHRRHVTKRVDPDFHSQRYPSRSSSGTRLGMNVPLPRAISLPSLSVTTPSPISNRVERLTIVPRACISPLEIGRRK